MLACRSLAEGAIEQVGKERLIGWSAVCLALALFCAGLFELISGEFMPCGYRTDPAVKLSSGLLTAFRAWGPYLSGVTWLALAGVCLRVGLLILRDAGPSRGSSRDAS